MKILIGMLLLGALGAGSYGLTSHGATAAGPASPEACEATVTCTPEGHCQITCHRPDGSTCSIELACDGEHCSVVQCSGPGACSPEGALPCQAPCKESCR